MSIFEGFTTFNFNEGAPYVSFTKNGVSFNKSVIMKLGYPKNVILLINQQSKQIGIKVCDETDPNATSFYKEEKKKNGVLSVRWNGRDLMNTIREMMNWDLDSISYRAEGQHIKEEQAMLFDLNKSTTFR